MLLLWSAIGASAAAETKAGPMPESSKTSSGQGQPPKSLDELDRKQFNPGPEPMSSPAKRVVLKEGPVKLDKGPVLLSLDGAWQMAENGEQAARLHQPWPDAIPAVVPGSVHAALEKAGKIPDPKRGLNEAIAREKSFQTWWFKRTFRRPAGLEKAELCFDGVAIHCAVWLNGTELGQHEGMFGGPKFEVASLLREENELVVKIDPAPEAKNPDYEGANDGWKKTVVFNNVWGWHYSNIPALGIWRSVRLEGSATVKMDPPFVATRDAQAGLLDLSVKLTGPAAGWKARLAANILPENFQGQPLHFQQRVEADGAETTVRLQFKVPEPRLWWPNGCGDQNLYRLSVSVTPEGLPGAIADAKTTTFGIRTIEMAPQPDGPKESDYNWTFVINGRPMFMNGTGWCTMDSSMDFRRERYDRFLSLAKQQNVQMLRGWGSGMPETDDFYDLCDRYGLLVMQEWPTAWNSHNTQPYDVLEETVRLNTIRLRNRPSLAMWGGGNESKQPFGKAIDMMGRYATELDGTRPFHRGEPWGGSLHNYNCSWGRKPLDRNLSLTAIFLGEFGITSLPIHESVLRYLPDDEKELWPQPINKSFAHHTPMFNRMKDVAWLEQYAGYFTAAKNLREFIRGSQVAQAVALRHPLELARTRWPHSTGALYYKLNDNYPAASWSTVDWYGAPKIAHYFCQDAFAPLHACVLFSSLSNQGQSVEWPVFLLDDATALKDSAWEVVVRAYDAGLKLVKAESFHGKGSITSPRQLGNFSLTAAQTNSTPLLVVSEIKKNGVMADRTFYFVNYEQTKDSLFGLPRTKLSLEAKAGKAVVTNTGTLPAVGVAVLQPGRMDTFTANDNYFWLDPGESHTVEVNSTEGLTLEAWNLE